MTWQNKTHKDGNNLGMRKMREIRRTCVLASQNSLCKNGMLPSWGLVKTVLPKVYCCYLKLNLEYIHEIVLWICLLKYQPHPKQKNTLGKYHDLNRQVLYSLSVPAPHPKCKRKVHVWCLSRVSVSQCLAVLHLLCRSQSDPALPLFSYSRDPQIARQK